MVSITGEKPEEFELEAEGIEQSSNSRSTGANWSVMDDGEE
jgi:hypothetical protein